MSRRAMVWGLSLLCALIAAIGYSLATPVFDAPSYWRPLCFALMGGFGLCSVFLLSDFQSKKGLLRAIWIPAILLRIAMLPAAPSDDVNRYLWEGKLVTKGVSPYAQTADSEAVEMYRDIYWAGMNHRDKGTAYPPLAELSFAAVSGIYYHPLAFKVFYLLVDLWIIAGILALLRQRGLSPGYAGFYALNPLALVAFAGEGHFDVLMLAALVWSLWAWERGRSGLAAVLLSVATGIKWITLPLLPFLLIRDRGKVVLCAAVTLLLPGLVFWDSLSSLVRGLLAFGGGGHFNGAVYDLLHLGLELPRGLCTGLVLGGFAGIVFWRWLARCRWPLDTHILWILGALVVLSPTVHFWYLVWVLPFICLRPSALWLTFTFSAGSYFFVWTEAVEGAWGLAFWQKLLFWGPFFVVAVYDLWSTRGRVVLPMVRAVDAGSNATVSVVIPVYNVGGELRDALKSIEAQTVPALEVIIADAGDLEQTRRQTPDLDLQIVHIEAVKGRGQQISKGIETASGEWVIVLHADGCLPADAVSQLIAAAGASPHLIGGALGQRFVEQSWRLLVIEVLNDLRALFTRTAFGDQIQFFHRGTAVKHGLMPAQPLMEDVESSWRVRELGEFRYLGCFGVVSAQKWLRSGWLERVRLVLRLVSRYRWARLKGRKEAEAISETLYSEYYDP